MKKILALVLALVLVACAATAVADTPSKTNDNIAGGGVVVNPKGGEDTETVSLEIIENTEATQKVIDTFKDAFDAGDVLAALPEDVRGALPEGLTKINEMLTAQFVGDAEALDDTVVLNVSFETPFEPAGDPVAFLFGKLAGEEVEWTVKDGGEIKDDGSIDITLTKDFIQDMIEAQPFLLAVVSK